MSPLERRTGFTAHKATFSKAPAAKNEDLTTPKDVPTTGTKTLPTVVASATNRAAIEVVAFEGAHKIENRDAVGFYFEIRREPGAETSRLAVLFSGTVMAVRHDLFDLPPLGDRQSTFITFAEAAIGDYLDESGLPEFTPAGSSAAKIDCFSPHFQAWHDRPPAKDSAIEDYLIAHVVQTWNYGSRSWTCGPSDLLRLRRSFADVLRMVRLHEGEAWSVSELSESTVVLTPLPAFLRSQVSRRSPSVPDSGTEPMAQDASPAAFVYVDEERIAELRRLEVQEFDLRKLLALCEELNQCYRAQCYHAVAALTRALMDHVPPLLGLRTFSEVASNYSGTKSFKECMRRLEEAARKIADAHLHTPIRKSEVLPTRVQVNFSNEVDVLLSEVIRRLKSTPRAPED